jgi:hypothetical protein
MLQSAGDNEGAEPLFRRSLAMCRALFEGDHPDTALVLHHWAWVIARQGRIEDAEAPARESVEMYSRHQEYPFQEHWHAVDVLEWVLGQQGDWGGATAHRRHLVARVREEMGPEHPMLASALLALAAPLLDIGTEEAARQAEPPLRECLAIRESLFPDGSPNAWRRYSVMTQVGIALLNQSRHAEAEAMLLEGYQKLDPPPMARARKLDAAKALVRLYEQWDGAKPGAGHDAQAERWRAELAAQEAPGGQR